MKACLVNTPFDLFRDGYGTRCRIRAGHLPPLGIGIVAAVLEKSGFDVTVVDASALGYDIGQTADAVRRAGPDIIGISALTASADTAARLISVIKKELSVPVVLGGPHATCFPGDMLSKCPDVDALVCGEAEKAASEVFSSLAAGKKPGEVKGAAYIDENGRVKVNKKAEPLSDLDAAPWPAWHLFDHSLYSPLPNQYRRLPATSLITSRGCPYARCKFCFEAGLMKQGYRRNSPEYVIEEIKMLSRDYGIREICFWDDNFMFNGAWLETFCAMMIKELPGMIWSCYGRADSVTKENLALVRKAGCWSMFIGFESGDQQLLDVIGKGITLEQCRNAARWASQEGIQVRGSFMLGLPGETPRTAKKVIDLAVEMDLYSAQFLPAYPEYGTELYDLALQKGRLVTKYEGRAKAAYVPDGYEGPRQLEDMIHLAYRKFYLRPRYIWKLIRQIRGWEDIKRYAAGLKFILGLVY
ncbi:MAG: cobalamin-dependent protein [Elusimicrobia bacterium]|nr:cobalamin-dependent protein [Elusimicrobiota bacterium]